MLRGEGRAFSAGLDRRFLPPDGGGGAVGLRELAAAEQHAATERIASWQRAFDWTSDPAVVSIAAVQGYAIGAGFQLALGADIRVLADDASLRIAEPALGLVPDLGGTKRLVELVGYSRAVEICLTARPVTAQDALRIGLASQVVPRDELDSAVDRLVEALLAVPREAAAETKALLLHAASRSQREQEQFERDAQYRRLREMTGLDRET